MQKNFTVILPDEPYKISIDKNIVITAKYQGPRYLVGKMHVESKKVIDVQRTFDSVDEIDLSSYVEEGHAFIIIDAAINTFEAAFLTRSYTHGEVSNYTETLSTGEVYEYHYEDGTGILEQIYFPFTLGYDTDNSIFTEPARRTHFITRESYFEGMATFPDKIAAALAINDYSDEDKDKLEQHKTWLENLSTTYANVDHWKIPYPINLPPF